MIRAELRHLECDDVPDLETWCPATDSFAIGVCLQVGAVGSEGGDNFYLEVCTPPHLVDRLADETIVSGRHRLIVGHFNYQSLVEYVRKYVASCSGDTWDEVAGKVSRLGHWEFEDYVPYEGHD